MSEKNFEGDIDTSQLESLMSELNVRQLRSAWKAGLRPSAKLIERGVIAELEASHPSAVKYRSELSVSIWRKGGGYTVGLTGKQINVTMTRGGKQVFASHLYILRWLTRGTAQRQTKKGFNRGKIKGSQFFARGVEKSIEVAVSRLGDDIIKAMERAVARAKKSGQPIK